MIRVYVAGPIGAKDDGRADRLKAGVDAGFRLLAAGLAPFVPHLWAASGHGAADGEIGYEQFMDYDFAWLAQCHAVLRLPGQSPGADREVALASAMGMPVFHDEPSLIKWASTRDP